MAKKSDVNKSEEIRQLLKENPKMKAKAVVAALAERGISVTEGLVYFIKGKAKGRRGRKKRAKAMVAKAAASGSADPLATILKIKSLADDVGGIKKLKALIDALTE
jgi:hypothetical protein